MKPEEQKLERSKTVSGDGRGSFDLFNDAADQNVDLSSPVKGKKKKEGTDLETGLLRDSVSSTGTGNDSLDAPSASAGACCSTKTKFAMAGVLTLAVVAAILLYATNTVTMKNFS